MIYKHILVTTDLSEDSTAAFEHAAYQAKFDGSRITLLTVVSDWQVPTSLYPYMAGPERIEEYRSYLADEAKKQLERYRDRFHGQQITPAVVLSTRPVAQEITDFAAKNSCDLVVMSSRGHGALGVLFLGSTLQAVLKLSTCPVLVIPPPKKRE